MISQTKTSSDARSLPLHVEAIDSQTDSAVMQERERIANELHDVLASGLHVAILHLYEARRLLSSEPDQAEQLMETAQQEVLNCWADARRSVVALRPLNLDRCGLLGALQSYASRIEHTFSASVSLNVCGTPRVLQSLVELGVLRVVQEAVTNALRHSGARAISIELSFDPDALRIEVTDNGIGFDPNDAHSGSGVDSMRSRIRQLRGDVQILSDPGHGTQVIATVPLPRNEPPSPSLGDGKPVEIGLTLHQCDLHDRTIQELDCSENLLG
jgi:signal transduction histidine kinase